MTRIRASGRRGARARGDRERTGSSHPRLSRASRPGVRWMSLYFLSRALARLRMRGPRTNQGPRETTRSKGLLALGRPGRTGSSMLGAVDVDRGPTYDIKL